MWGTSTFKRAGAAASILVVACLAAAALGVTARGAVSVAAAKGNPFVGAALFVDPYSNAQSQVDRWKTTRPADAERLMGIASQPTVDWFTGGTRGPIAVAVRRRINQAKQAGALPVFVAQGLPDNCSMTRPLSLAAQTAYRRWINGFVQGIAANRTVVILEPNGLVRLNCLPVARRNTRLALLRYAVAKLASKRGVTVYIDAGHSRSRPAKEIALALKRVGVGRTRGFALNVSQYNTTKAETAYGNAISSRIGRKPFVIDTGRNGAGPLVGSEVKRPVDYWCNVRDRALGSPPKAKPGPARVDAFLWIKPPGESDGKCNGGPHAGKWWAEYALGLARRATQ